MFSHEDWVKLAAGVGLGAIVAAIINQAVALLIAGRNNISTLKTEAYFGYIEAVNQAVEASSIFQTFSAHSKGASDEQGLAWVKGLSALSHWRARVRLIGSIRIVELTDGIWKTVISKQALGPELAILVDEMRKDLGVDRPWWKFWG